jgi:hypothetical protein
LTLKFVFVGGPYDGKTLRGVVGAGSEAERYFLLTNWGTLGQRFKVASEYAIETLARERLKNERRHYFQRHFYAVSDRSEDDGEVWVRADYSSDATTSAQTST